MIHHYTSMWTPRTRLHLREIWHWINKEQSSLRSEYVYDSNYDYILIHFTTGVQLFWFDDGFALLKLVSDDTKWAHTVLHDGRAWHERVVGALFSQHGAPIPSTLLQEKVEFHLLSMGIPETTSLEYSQEQSRILGCQLREGENTESGYIVHADTWTFISPTFDESTYDSVATLILFSGHVAHTLGAYLRTHRRLWDEITTWRESRELRLNELPLMRDRLMTLHRDVNFVSSRLHQIGPFVEARKKYAQESQVDYILRNLKLENSEEHIRTVHYVSQLWLMTKEYIDSTVNLVNLLYQENVQKELNSLQIVFMVATVASVLSLGSIAGSETIVLNTFGEETAKLITTSFTLQDLIRFGIWAILIAGIVYISLHILFNNIKRFKIGVGSVISKIKTE